MPFKLKRLNQCDKCPWKVSTDPHDIPLYDRGLHERLGDTIAEPGFNPQSLTGAIRIFSCHESADFSGAETHCVGWLMNQIGPGNNIALRLSMRDCENLHLVKLDGEQHKNFDDTLLRTGADDA